MTFANRKLTVAKCAEQKHVLQDSQDRRSFCRILRTEDILWKFVFVYLLLLLLFLIERRNFVTTAIERFAFEFNESWPLSGGALMSCVIQYLLMKEISCGSM